MKFKALLLLTILIFSSANADEKVNKVLEELQQIKKDLKTLEKAVYSQSFKGSGKKQVSGSLEGALTRQLVKITELEEQMQKLTASHEEAMFSFEQLNERLNKTQRDNELRLSDLEVGNFKKISKKNKTKKFPGTDKPQNLGTMVTQKETEQQTSSVNPASVVKIEEAETKEILPKKSPEEQYKFATSLIKVGDYDQAELALKEFVKKNPKHKLAGNAQYWYAETFYIRQLYHDAAAAYLDGYQKYPRSLKGPQNLLKLGVTLSELGEKDQGCQMLDGIKKQYPKAKQSVIQKAKYEKKKYKCPSVG
ncbi:MAG: tol-pal system protein YbgF [Candidatus Pelagibacter sp.]|nr:tol-pal system protein YbgF [Candidatus Pelagibacter sp.]MAK12206.1 tol-pal system protein YbgF [Candidatus Pelagibacter sp.]|tara:strand:- start:1709 stop:2629 length:921 start_codon:yes stop_codon:yes gene_type:complete